MAEEEEDVPIELTTFQVKECYVYQVPPAGTIGHRAELWNVDKWLQEVSLSVITCRDDCTIRMVDMNTGELFAECPIPNNMPLSTAVEPVVDSSRYFVLRLEDRATKRHAFIGIGFRERTQASDFNSALYEHQQYLRRKKEAVAMREAFESGAGGSGGEDGSGARGSSPHQDLSLKPGETITIKLANARISSDRPAGPVMRGAKLHNPINLFGSPGGESAASGASPSGGKPVLPPPPRLSPSATGDGATSSSSSSERSPHQPVMGPNMRLLSGLLPQPDLAAAAQAPAPDSGLTESESEPATAAEGSSDEASAESAGKAVAKAPVGDDDWGDFKG